MIDNKSLAAAEYLKERDFGAPFGLITGSGLGDMIDIFEKKISEPYSSIPGFPVSTVPGHEGALVQLYHGRIPIIVMKGRFHYYEGYSGAELSIPIDTLHELGVETLFITNAAGSMREDFNIGDFMLIRDYINWSCINPLIGLPDPPDGRSRFIDMSDAYSSELRRLAFEVKPKEMVLREGVLACFSGPSYETASEVAAVRMLGGDVASMSTVPETLVAKYLGMKVMAVSCITNHTAGVGSNETGHQAVLDVSEKNAPILGKLVAKVLEKLYEGD